MRTLPRHLLLAAVVLTVCCAERGAVHSMIDLQKVAAEMAGVAGESATKTRHTEQQQHRRQVRRIQVRPAVLAKAARRRAVFAPVVSSSQPVRPVVHAIYPPSRFRLPPPMNLV